MFKIAKVLQYFIDNHKVSSIMKGEQMVQCFRNLNTTTLAYYKCGTQRVYIKFKEEYGVGKLKYTGTTKDIDSLNTFIYG